MAKLPEGWGIHIGGKDESSAEDLSVKNRKEREPAAEHESVFNDTYMRIAYNPAAWNKLVEGSFSLSNYEKSVIEQNDTASLNSLLEDYNKLWGIEEAPPSNQQYNSAIIQYVMTELNQRFFGEDELKF